MNLIVCAIYDDKAKAYNRPIFVPSKGLAIRSFIDEANRAAQDNTLYQHPEDFHLAELGTYDEDTGTFTNITPTPHILMRGKDAKQETA